MADEQQAPPRPQIHPLLERFDRLEFSKFLGIRITEFGDGTVSAKIDIEERHANLMSALHGGIIYAAADAVGFAALLTVLEHQESAATVDISVSVLRACGVGDTLELVGHVVKRGKRVSFVETGCSVNGKVIATAKITKAMLEMP